MFLHLYIDCWACKLNCRIQDYAEQPVWSHFMFFNFMFKKKKKKGVDVQLFRITHMATEISKTLYNKMISLWSW